jgi:hypothetical protein
LFSSSRIRSYGDHNLWHCNIAWHFFFLRLVFHCWGVNFVQECSINSSHAQRSLKDIKKSPNPQYICFEPYATPTYLWWSIHQRQETHIKPYWKRVAIKTNCPSLSTEKQNSEYLLHFTYMLIPSSMP